MGRTIHTLALVSSILVLASPFAQASIFIEALGFEDDVDMVVAPNQKFIVVPEEKEGGTAARIRIIGLDPTGLPTVLRLEDNTLVGYENGVDPIIIDGEGVGFGFLILVPTESQDGSNAHLLQWATDVVGTPFWSDDIDLDDLGFREDVDCIWDAYTGSIAFFLLESENHSVRGILAIDVDGSDGDFGSCLLLSSDGRLNGDANMNVDWLPGFAEGVDPELYEKDDRLRLAAPVTSTTGSDLLLVDFDSDVLAGDAPPVYMSHSSVKAINAARADPTAFPGWERDVDIMLLEGAACEVNRSLVIPVEGPGDVADLYKIDEDGTALWVYSIDDKSGVSIKGYEAGVDLLKVCNIGVAPDDRLLVPVENAAGTDADLLIINIANGHLVTHLEDPTLNPGLVIPGWEIGVDVVRWVPGHYVAAVEGGATTGLIVFNPSGVVVDDLFDPNLLGFRRSVDPIVAPTGPPTLVVPIGTDDGSNGDVWVFPTPPNLGAFYSMEGIRSGLTLNPFAWDVDLGLIDKTAPGELYVCLAEETPVGNNARLRFELTAGLAGDRVLVVATDAVGATPGSLYMVDLPTASILVEKNDVLGIETGLDMVSGSGPITPGVFPLFPRLTGVDHDGDPTLAGDVASSVSRGGPRIPRDRIPLRHTNPFVAPGRIEYALAERARVTVDVFDVAGRVVSRAFDGMQEAGVQGVTWRAHTAGGRPLPSGVYLVRVSANGRTGVSKLVLVR